MSALTTQIAVTGTPVARRRSWVWWIAGVVSILLLVIAGGLLMMLRSMAEENTPPPNLDVSRTRVSVQGMYQGSYTPALEPLTIDKLHSWTLHLETADGQPVENATITVHGDMPGHGHGLPTNPLVSQHQGNGDYLVEGMKFQFGPLRRSAGHRWLGGPADNADAG